MERPRVDAVSASPTTPSGKPSFEETLVEYMRTRVVYSQPPTCILVDAFRHARSFQLRRTSEWANLGESPHNAASEPAPSHFLYFLSHFHSDHYTGLSPSWSHGTIFCSPGTAALVQQQLGVAASFIQPLRYGETYLLDLTSGALLTSPAPHHADDRLCRVELVPANHCPDAAIFVFHCPSPVGCVVHTGDLRFNRTLDAWRQQALGLRSPMDSLSTNVQALRRCFIARTLVQRAQHSTSALLPLITPFYEQFIGDSPVLSAVAGTVETLFLDNTFCDPAFRFPTQWDSTQAVLETARSLFLRPCADASGNGHQSSKEEVNVIVLIASYVIGKERVAFALQEAFPPLADGENGDTAPANVPIYVPPSKYDTLTGMDFFPGRFSRLCADGEDSPRTAPDCREVRPHSVRVSLPITLQQAVTACHAGDTHANAPATSQSRATTSRALDFTDAQSTSDDDEGHAPPTEGTRYNLTIVLVPFSALSYPVLAPACGLRLRKRSRAHGSGDADGSALKKETPPPSADAADTPASEEATTALHADSQSPVLDIGDGLALSLLPYDHVLAVMPTGWTRKPKSRRITDRCTQLDIPYSEHCSFDELMDFVAFLNPRRVVPTVSAEQFRKQEPLFVERAPRLRAQNGSTQPLTRFWQAAAGASQAPPARADAASGCSDDAKSDTHHGKKPTNPFSPAVASARLPTLPSAVMKDLTSTGTLTSQSRSKGTCTSEVHGAQQGSLASFGITRDRVARRQAPTTSVKCEDSDDDAVVLVGVAPTVVEISDDD